MWVVLLFGVGVVFLIALFLVVRLGARTHEDASPVTEDPPVR